MDLAELRAELACAPLPAGWGVCSCAEGLALAAQLRKELRPGHALHGRGCVAVAKHGACAEVLFFVEEEGRGGARLARVHLTWRVPREAGGFPWAEEFASLREWNARTTG